MIEGRATTLIAAPRERIIAFVTDLDQYRLADHKIGRVLDQHRTDTGIRMRHGGSMRGVPGPPVTLDLTLHAGRVAYRSVRAGIAGVLMDFEGGFDLTPVPGDVEAYEVTHLERFHFRGPFRWIAEPWLRAWLQADVRAEVARIKELLEAP